MVLLPLAVSPAVRAEGVKTVERPLWELGLGIGALRLPHYRGSDQTHSWLFPVPYVVYRGDIFKADREGARAVLLETDRIDFDVSLAASVPTRSSDDDARRGMDDLSPTLEIGPNLNVTLARGSRWKLQARVPVRAAVTVESHPHMIGWTSTPNLNLDLRLHSNWNLGVLAGPIYATRRFNAYYYSVEPADATVNRPAYSAPGGSGGAQATLALSKRFAQSWAGLFVRFDTLRGARFAASPLVREREQWSFGVAWSWVFASSTEQVAVPDD